MRLRKKEKSARLYLRIPEDQKAQLLQFASTHKTSLSEVARDAFTEYLEKYTAHPACLLTFLAIILS
jgi:hypothetical protein